MAESSRIWNLMIMRITRKYIDDLSYKIIGCAIEVHKQIGPGLLESVYEKCFLYELSLHGLQFENQVWIPVNYKGITFETELRCDVLVENSIVVESKSAEKVLPIHQAILLSYMRLLNVSKGIIINFHCEHIFNNGQMTMVNSLYAQLPEK